MVIGHRVAGARVDRVKDQVEVRDEEHEEDEEDEDVLAPNRLGVGLGLWL